MTIINAEQFGIIVKHLSDLDDYDFKMAVKTAKQFRKAQKMLMNEQIRLKQELKENKAQRSGLKYELAK